MPRKRNEFSMTVFKRAGRDFYECQWTDPVTGRKKTRSTGETKRKDADRFAGKLADDLANDRVKDRNGTTWDAFCDRYETEVAPSKSARFAMKVQTVFNAIDRIIAPKLLRSLDTTQLSTFQRALRDEGLSEATIKGYLAYLSAMLHWAKDQDMLDALPKFNMPTRTATAKGRPITAEEFDRMLDKAESVMGADAAPSWKYLMRGLWASGLRLGEALALHWTDGRKLCADLSGRRPVLRIQADGHKANRYVESPIVPEFYAVLCETPEADRTGHVFNPLSQKGHVMRSIDTVSRVIVATGEAAGVKVVEKPRKRKLREGQSATQIKYASAHDFRRAFGTRWAKRVMPAILQQLMRHESINTTLSFYATRNAEAAADVAWEAVEAEQGQNANSAANSDAFQPQNA